MRWFRARLRRKRPKRNQVAPCSFSTIGTLGAVNPVPRLVALMATFNDRYQSHLCNDCPDCAHLLRVINFLAYMYLDIHEWTNIPYEIVIVLNMILTAVRDNIYYGIDTSMELSLSIMARQRAHLNVYDDLFLSNGNQIAAVIGQCDPFCPWCKHYMIIQTMANYMCVVLNCSK